MKLNFRVSVTVPSTWEVSSIVSMGVTLESQIDTQSQDSTISIRI